MSEVMYYCWGIQIASAVYIGIYVRYHWVQLFFDERGGQWHFTSSGVDPLIVEMIA